MPSHIPSLAEALAAVGVGREEHLVEPDQTLPGRARYLFDIPERHEVLGTPLQGPWPEGDEVIYLALGCFWGEEKLFWQVPGVYSTAVGYQGGQTPHPTYEEVCTSRTNHAETVQVVYDPQKVTTRQILAAFWEAHDPTQGFRQGNDSGTQYRSAIFWTTPEQRDVAEETRALFQERLQERGYGDITTEIESAEQAGPFYYAEPYHQQYLLKNPNGYCPVHATGVACA